MAITGSETRGQLNWWIGRIGWGAVFCVVLSGVVLLGTLAFVLVTGIQFGDMTREPALSMASRPPVNGQHPPYLSGLWHLGILGWCVGAVMSGVAAAIAYRHRLGRRWTRFLAVSSVFTTAMLFDDLFLLHEYGYPALFNISELTVLLTYMVLAVAYLAAFWREMMASHQAMLVLAMAGFASSLAIDLSPLYTWRQVFEDSPKFLGIVCWAGYHAALAVDTVDAAVKRSVEQSAPLTLDPRDEWARKPSGETSREDSPTGVL